LEGDDCVTFFLDGTTPEDKTGKPTASGTRLILVGQIAHYRPESVKTDAIAGEADALWMELDAHSIAPHP
jgi:hypothetical protein